VSRSTNVAALYVDPLGVYPALTEHWYAAHRDARTYAGPWPIVAHPPCGPWSSLRHLHTHPEDARLGLVAIEQVRKWGGVLEQPAGSRLWAASDPPITSTASPGFAICVEQVSWGHVARKKTWLYFVGVDRQLVVDGVRFGGTPTHWASGGHQHDRKGSGGFVPEGIKICSAQQRNRTPIAFANWLLDLATTARP